MKLLADENFPPSLVSYLQKNKYDVKRIQRSLHGVSDFAVREKALVERRIINAISQLKRKKKLFIACYSEAGLEIIF